MEKAFPFGFDQEGYAGVCRSECLDPQVMIFIEISFFEIDRIFFPRPVPFQNIFAEKIDDIFFVCFPSQYLRIEMIRMEMG